MPTIECNKHDLFDLIGEEMSDDELEEILTRVKVEVEEIIDDRLEVEITSDRIDLLSVEGIARAVRSWKDNDPGLSKYDLHESTYSITVDEVPVRPHVVTAVVRNVDLNTAAVKSLIQLQEKLHGTFGRDRERVSIGIHDMTEIDFPLTYTAAAPDEYSFVPLERDETMSLEEILEDHEKGQAYADLVTSHDRWPVIVDDNEQVLSFPPIINSRKTEVTTASRDLFIDVTGTDLESLQYALNVIVTALAERGGEIHEVEMHAQGDIHTTPDFSTDEMEIDLAEIEAITGIELDRDSAREYLEKMGYGLVELGDELEVLIPPYRADILHQVDIAEDVAIGYGYNNLDPEIPDIATIGEADPMETFMHSIRDLMTGFGYQELMNPTLSDEQTLARDANRDEDGFVRLANPVSDKYTIARDMLIPQLLGTLADNTHNEYPQKIFEAADVIRKDEDSPTKTRTDKHLAALHAGQEVDYTDVKQVLEGFFESLGVEVAFEKEYHPTFIEGRTAEILLDGIHVGTIGEINPAVLNNIALEMPVAGFELRLDRIHDLV